MRYLAIIPARAGSKGLPGKNILDVNGHPLIAWSIRQALAVPAIATVVVSTDSERIAAIAREYGAATPFLRPDELSRDETPTEPVMEHALNWHDEHGVRHDAVILLQPTSPLRLTGTLQRAVTQFESEGAESLLGVCPTHAFFWKKGPPPTASYDFMIRPRRQDIPPEQRLHRETGSVYITQVDAFKAHRNRLCGKVSVFEMDEVEGFEIDSETDMVVVRSLMKALALELPHGR